jgi:dTDP-4-dehydrorhamnose 3,5-epimerase
MSRFGIVDTPISGLKIVERNPRSDERGFLARLFCAGELQAAGWSKPIEQINQTMTRRSGAVRGMHFQCPPHAEMKLVSCIRGEVWDVALDLRRGSPTFLKWFGANLSADNGRALLIPEGFAHGFQALTEDCELIYLHSCAYHAESEGGVNPQDPSVAIDWPRVIAEMSPRDRGHPMLSPDFEGIPL